MKTSCSLVSRGVRRALPLLLTLLFVAGASRASAQTYDRSGPWWRVVPRPLHSVAYTPEPADYDAKFTCPYPDGCKYFDSDFYNADFKLLWGPGGRNDLIYDLDQRNNGRKTHHGAAVIWDIGNEYDINGYPAANVAQVAKIVVDLENAAGIPDSEKLVFTSPVSFAALNGKPAAIHRSSLYKRPLLRTG